jgi:hypothetical protein
MHISKQGLYLVFHEVFQLGETKSLLKIRSFDLFDVLFDFRSLLHLAFRGEDLKEWQRNSWR